MTRTPSFLGEESAMKLIPNELLCYAFNYADNSTVSSLSACLCEFYQPQEISSAREILWKEYEQVISTLTKKTRRSQAPTDAVSAKPFAEDIGVWINHVKNNTSASIMTTFCAVNIRKIPNCPPEEINLFSIVARLGALEKKLEDSEPTVHRVQTREDIAAPLAPVADDQLQTAVNEPPQKTSGVRPLVAQAEWTSVVKKRMNKKKKIRIAAKELTAVVGSASDCSIKASEPVRHVFINKVDKQCTNENIHDYIKKKGIIPKDVRRTSKEGWLSTSFKISVPSVNFNDLLKAEFWPSGIRCREWLSYIPRKRIGSANADLNENDAFLSDGLSEEEEDAHDSFATSDAAAAHHSHHG
jgi:hypothetical protein